MKNILFVLAIFVSCTKAQSQSWNINGNAGTNSTTNFIGTTDNAAFKIRTKNTVRITVNGTGKVGIGISSPVAKLHVKGNTNEPQLIIDASSNQSNASPLIKLRKNDGTDLLHIHSDDSTNIFMGINAGRMNDTTYLSWDGTRNTFIGSNAGSSNTTGSRNTALGNRTLASNTTGWLNTAIGESALAANTYGTTNTAVGVATLEYNTTGQGNTGCGFRALNQNVTGQWNTACGYQTLFSNNTGERNSAFGYEALLYNYNGTYNTAGGFHSMRNNTSGSINTAYGYYSLFTNTTGNWNTATGHQALYFNNGTANTADGLNALYNNISGSNNTAVGKDAMFYSTAGSLNTIIGHASGCNNGYNPSNFAAFGYNAGHLGNNSNTIEIGNSSVTWIGGNPLWSTYSDERIKDNIQSNVPGLSFITKLNPVTYNLNIHRQNEICGIKDTNEWEGKYDIEKIVQTGFLAQEVEQAAKECNYDFNGVHAPSGNAKLYSVQYASFVVPLVKSVQELSKENEELKAEVRIQKSENNELKSRIERLESVLGLTTAVFQPPTSAFLLQNAPNPFTEKSVINYNIPPASNQAVLKIYSADGKELNSYSLPSKGAGQIEINGNTLAAGIYNYTLFIDGKATDSKQMIITK